MAKNKAAAILTAVMAVAVAVLRMALLPLLTAPELGWFRWNYLPIGLLAVTIAAVFILGRFPKEEARRVISGKPLFIPATAGVLGGGILAAMAIYDAGKWFFYKETPPPNKEVFSNLDAITLALMLLAGILGGIALIRCWLTWIEMGRTRAGIFPIWALTPALWAWLRLARYEMSYISAVDFSQNFFDFMMMIFQLLFFFMLARYISGMGSKPSRLLPAFALCTGLFSLSGSAAQLAVFLNGEKLRYAAGNMASITDFIIGVFAMLFAFVLIWKGRPETAEDRAITQEETVSAISEQQAEMTDEMAPVETASDTAASTGESEQPWLPEEE